MLSDLFVMLFLIAMVLFIVYHFYIDYRNWSNTGNTFAEGMTSGETPLITREGESKAWNPPFKDLSTRGGTKNKLGAGEGDCDSDSQCLDGLKCKQRTVIRYLLSYSILPRMMYAREPLTVSSIICAMSFRRRRTNLALALWKNLKTEKSIC